VKLKFSDKETTAGGCLDLVPKPVDLLPDQHHLIQVGDVLNCEILPLLLLKDGGDLPGLYILKG